MLLPFFIFQNKKKFCFHRSKSMIYFKDNSKCPSMAKSGFVSLQKQFNFH